MAGNLCAAHTKTDLRAAHIVLLACFLQSCSTQRYISCSARNRACVLYMKVNSHVTREFGPSHWTKIQEHMRIATRECQLRCERYRMYDIISEVISQAFIILGAIASQVLNVCCHCKPSHNQYLAFDTVSFVIAMTAQCS